MQQSGLSLLLFCVPLYDLLSFLVHCCSCIWNQHCLAWKIFSHILSVSRGKHLWETDLQNRLNHSWLSVLVCTSSLFVCTPETRRAEQYPNCGVLPPRSTLESISHFLGFSITRRYVSHRHAVSRDKTACASFHLKIRKLGEEINSDLFIGINSCTKLQYYTEFHLSPAISIHMSFTWDTLALLILGPTVSRMHVQEDDLLHGIAVCRLLILVSFLFELLSQFLSMRQAMYDLDVMSL